MKPFVRKGIAVLCVTCLLAYGALTAYLASGGDPARLGASESLDRKTGLWVERGWDTLIAGGEQVRGLWKHLPWTRPSGKPVVTASPAIRVYFAPCQPRASKGIDGAFLALLESAKDSIFCAFYELEWLRAADILAAKHDAGVTVWVVSDSDYKDREALHRCIEAGIPVVLDERSAFMHNKFCIVDGKQLWTGSTNITENGLFRNNNNAILITSPELCEDYAAEFDEMFVDHRFGPRSPANTPLPCLEANGVALECYFAPEDDVQREIIAELDEAGKTIDFMAFSFTSEPIAETMAKAIVRGVRVRGIFEKRGMGSRYCRDDYLASKGAEVRPDANPYTMHHKVIIIDSRTVITGSYNFSKSAEKENDENVLIVHAPGIATLYEQEFERLARMN